MKTGQSLSALTANLLLKLERQFKSGRPDIVLAHGDTTTCFATAVSCFYHQIPFFHVEAGLRTNRLNSPFPEEFNRQTIAPIAAHHFAPTELEKANLLRDGIPVSRITVSGSTIHDAIQTVLSQTPNGNDPRISSLNHKSIVAVTLHRREANRSIYQTLSGIKAAAKEESNALFVCPVHPNPKVQQAFYSTLEGLENVVLTRPMSYPHFISLLLKTHVVVTDSGGVQEEAAFLGKTVLLTRTETERGDGLESGLVRLIGHDSENVRQNLLEALRSKNQCNPILHGFIPPASQIICDHVERALR